MRFSGLVWALRLVLWEAFATAQTTSTHHNLTSTGCHDADTYTTCTQTAAGKAQMCEAAAAGGQDSAMALGTCGCVYYIEMMNCYMASCWNRVYECEYQEYAIQYISECRPSELHAAEIPFFPPPDNAPGACSCNVGKVYLAVNGSEHEGATCLAGVAETAAGGDDDAVTTANQQAACACCSESSALSAIYHLCPSTQPALIGIDNVLAYMASLQQPWASCSPYMSAYDCATELNFTPVAGGPFFTPNDLPPSGTDGLSVVAGTVPVPPSGTLFSYTNFFDSTVYTVTAAVDDQEAGFGGVTGVTTGVATDTSMAVGPTITLSSGAAGGPPRGTWAPSGIGPACSLGSGRFLSVLVAFCTWRHCH